MDRKYREEHPEETFDGGYHLYAQENRKSDDKLFQFYAGTGKIQGVTNARGIYALIKILGV